MTDVIDSKSRILNIGTYEAIQTFKYSLMASQVSFWLRLIYKDQAWVLFPFLMLRNVYIEVIRWCLQPQVTVYFDNHWYDNSIYRLIVHLFVDIWAYSIALVKIPPENSLPLLENCPQILDPVPVPPSPPHPKSNLNHTLRKTWFSRGNSTWGCQFKWKYLYGIFQ